MILQTSSLMHEEIIQIKNNVVRYLMAYCHVICKLARISAQIYECTGQFFNLISLLLSLWNVIILWTYCLQLLSGFFDKQLLPINCAFFSEKVKRLTPQSQMFSFPRAIADGCPGIHVAELNVKGSSSKLSLYLFLYITNYNCTRHITKMYTDDTKDKQM